MNRLKLALRCWWHFWREHRSTTSIQFGPDGHIINCSCGGVSRIHFIGDWPDGHGMLVEETTCPVMERYRRRMHMQLPAARLAV